MALKDWKRVGRFNVWRNNKINQDIFIRKHELGKGRNLYKVEVWTDWGFTSQKRKWVRDLKTESQALKFARSYMRRN